jgi:hypothetical protein
MSIAAIALTVESQVGYIADFIPEQISSNEGIAAFVVVSAIFAVTQYYILGYVNQSNKERRFNARHLNVMHRGVTIAQFLLAGVIAFVILQILVTQEYNIAMLYLAQSVSYGLWIVTMGILAYALFSWYRLSYKNIMILILALSMAAYVANGVLGLLTHFDFLAQQNFVIRSGDVAAFPVPSLITVGDQINLANTIAVGIGYVFTWIGTVIMLRPYLTKIGRIKFWTIMAVAMVYYLIQFPLDFLGYYSPSEEANAMAYILIFSLAAVFTGIIFGAAFLSVARGLPKGTAVRENMTIAAYGFVLFYIAGSAMVSQAAYPPYGLVSVSFTGLSCYLIYNGLYSAAVSISRDSALRQSIRKSVNENSKLLGNIGTAQMEKELHARIMASTKKASDIETEKTGVEPTMTEDDMKSYLEGVINEVKKSETEQH